MAGERLARYMKQLKPKESEMVEVVYGTVISATPLKIRREDGLEIPSAFITLSEVAKGLSVSVSGTRYTIVKAVQTGDRVRMLQAQKSQMFYVLERV
ncbi:MULTISPECIES: DUF2577 family protein [unclassified Aerococcus]|uniref:DUF2577 family protein n=1 Tax=unclassified Aerococcus TaxID=2618060 RepID=UPI0025BB897C|nr:MULTISPECIES: DUF2577 family protein [unclassified Aerococcus]